MKRKDLTSIATIPLSMTLANSMLIPVIPKMQKVLGIGALQASLIITSYAIVAIFLISLTSYLSDRIGRKKVILSGLLLVAASGFRAGWAVFREHPYNLILWSRLLQGLGASACFPVLLPLAGDLFRSEDDVSNRLGIVETANTFGKVLRPVLGSALALWAWYNSVLDDIGHQLDFVRARRFLGQSSEDGRTGACAVSDVHPLDRKRKLEKDKRDEAFDALSTLEIHGPFGLTRE